MSSNLNFTENLDNYAIVDASVYDVHTGMLKKDRAVRIKEKKFYLFALKSICRKRSKRFHFQDAQFYRD